MRHLKYTLFITCLFLLFIPTSAAAVSSLCDLYDQCAPSVVHITGISTVSQVRPECEFFHLKDISEDENIGTGFIIHPTGYVITNAHVAAGSLMPVVELISGTRYEAEIIVNIPSQDLALLKIEPKEPLCAVKFAGPTASRVGINIFTIGSPHGLKFTLSPGIISGNNRSSLLTDQNNLTLNHLIQTDATINPGNSGGPWFDYTGSVVGITVSKRNNSDNIAFGISVTSLHQILPVMLAEALKGSLFTGFTPCKLQDIKEHCSVSCIIPNSPAARAGLSDGDIILSINDQPVHNLLDYYHQMLFFKPLQSIKIHVRRPSSQSEHTFQLIPSEPPPLDVDAIIRNQLKLDSDKITNEHISEFKLRIPRGVMITSVESSAYAQLEHPPRKGDILARINGIRPRNREHLAAILNSTPPGTPFNLVFLRVVRHAKEPKFSRIDITNFKPVDIKPSE